MKRLAAILAFAFGALAAELAHPLECSLIASSKTTLRRREAGRS
jgi:hypothetical protein